MTRRACIQLPEHVTHRREAFMNGVKACGYLLANDVSVVTNPRPDDLLVLWNRYGPRHDTATRFEGVGAAVIISENGYVGAFDDEYGKPMAVSPEGKVSQLYSLALNRHNGAGRWYVGSSDRIRQLGIQLTPWREKGEFILLLEQRGIGTAPVAGRRDWAELVMRRLKKVTQRNIKIRHHPGNYPHRRLLANDLGGAWCAMTWGSAAGVRALCQGYPVFSDFPQWIVRDCANPNLEDIENPICDDGRREEAITKVAWAQFTVEEIATGEPIQRLLDLHRSQREAA